MTGTQYRPGSAPRATRVSHEMSVPSASSDAPPIKLTCRWPQAGKIFGVVIFCHGLGGRHEYYAPLSEYWAEHGYLVIHPSFADDIRLIVADNPQFGLDAGSDDLFNWPANAPVRDHMLKILLKPQSWLDRLDRVDKVISNRINIADQLLGASLDTLPTVIAGHSFGAYVSQLKAGAEIDLPCDAHNFKDDRIHAAILLSAQGRNQQGLRDGSWDEMTMPVLNITGTLDRGAGGQDWRWKSEPFNLAPPGDKYNVVLEDAGHYLGGIAGVPGQTSVPAQLEAVQQLTLAFLDAQLKGDDSAKQWLINIADRVGDAPVRFAHK